MGRHGRTTHPDEESDGRVWSWVSERVVNHENHTSHAYAELEGSLAETRRTVAIDFRGHGLSSKVDCAMSAEVLADDVLAVCDHYEWERVVLAGHSLGAVTSMTVAARRPERVGNMVLLGAAASFELKFRRPPLPADEESFPAVIREANRRAAPLFFHESYPDVRRRVTASWSTILLKVHRNLVALEHPDLRPVVPALRMPTLVVAGEHDRCTTVGQARWIHEHVPDSELYIVPDSAHFMYMEQPSLVADRMTRFLDR